MYIIILHIGDIMDILKRIDDIRIQHNWSVYKLAEESGIGQSTLANMFARKTLPSLTTLQMICDAFKISLSEFFGDFSEFTSDEINVISEYRKLSDRDKKLVIQTINNLNNIK